MKRILSLLAVLIFITQLNAQDSTLTIGVKEAKPFVEYSKQNLPRGLSVEFWQLVQGYTSMGYEFKKFETIAEMLDAVSAGEVDLSINPITVTDDRMRRLDFSQPFYISGMAIARQHKSSWIGVLTNIFSWQFFSAVAVLLLVIFIFGLLIWYFERKKNSEQFGKGAHGLADGFWWSAVTMTTVGYGDKAPVTKGGRLVGFIWMFAGIIMISSLTAGIASALTVQSLGAKISSAEDLRRHDVGTISGSSSESYLQLFSVEPRGYSSVEKALRDVNEGKLEIFVYDRPIINYYLESNQLDDVVLSDKNLKTDYYSFSYPKGSELRDYLDPFVVKALKSEQWNYKLKSLEKEN